MRRLRFSFVWISFCLIVLWIGFLLFVIKNRTSASEWRSSEIIDLVIVPGGGVRDDATLPPWVIARLQRAAMIPRRQRRFIVCLSFGTPHKPPPLDGDGFPIREARASAQYLIQRAAVDPNDILVEELSLDTIGNAVFTRMLHADPLHLQRLHVITNRFHLERTEYIFRKVFAIDNRVGTELTFESVADDGLSSTDLQSRMQKEKEALESLRKSEFASLNSIEALHHWLFTNHSAYSLRPAKRAKLDRSALNSY